MATKIRLARHGHKDYAFYHIVVADSRSPRDGKIIERIGSFNPNTNPAAVILNFERALYWVNVGAQPTDTVRTILSNEGVLLCKLAVHIYTKLKKAGSLSLIFVLLGVQVRHIHVRGRNLQSQIHGFRETILSGILQRHSLRQLGEFLVDFHFIVSEGAGATFTLVGATGAPLAEHGGGPLAVLEQLATQMTTCFPDFIGFYNL